MTCSAGGHHLCDHHLCDHLCHFSIMMRHTKADVELPPMRVLFHHVELTSAECVAYEQTISTAAHLRQGTGRDMHKAINKLRSICAVGAENDLSAQKAVMCSECLNDCVATAAVMDCLHCNQQLVLCDDCRSMQLQVCQHPAACPSETCDCRVQMTSSKKSWQLRVAAVLKK